MYTVTTVILMINNNETFLLYRCHLIIITGKKKYPPITFEYSQEEIAAKAGIKVGIKSGLKSF